VAPQLRDDLFARFQNQGMGFSDVLVNELAVHDWLSRQVNENSNFLRKGTYETCLDHDALRLAECRKMGNYGYLQVSNRVNTEHHVI
jgi:hypothetical protein